MLTVEEYTAQFGKCWGLSKTLMPGVRLIKEGLLLFTPGSAACWGGPWEGGYAQFHIKDHSQETVTHGPNKGKLRLPIAKIEWEEHQAKEKRRAAFWGRSSGLSISERMGYPSVEFPVRLWMAGNDDTSYSKCYRNEENALTELALFIGNEPLDFHEVVHGFSFIFTN